MKRTGFILILSAADMPLFDGSGDANNFPDGMVYSGNGVSNVPQTHMFIETRTSPYGDGVRFQRAVNINSTGSYTDVYYRAKNISWGPWKRIGE